jgi:hypothetical protein
MWSSYIQCSMTDLPRKQEEWAARTRFLIYSIASWYLFHLCTVGFSLAARIWHRNVAPVNLGLESIKRSYEGIPVFLMVLVVATFLGLAAGAWDNKRVHECAFGWLRTRSGLKRESRKDVWTEEFVGKRDRLVRITLSNGKSICGIVEDTSNQESGQSMTVLPFLAGVDIAHFLDVPDVIYVDLANGTVVDIFDGRAILGKLRRE